MVPNHKPACNIILLWYLVNTQNMWDVRYPLQRPIFKKDLKISWNNGEKLVHYTHIMWYVFIYEFYYFCVNKTVNNKYHFQVLVPLGDDFTYSSEGEWDQQYTNYNQIIEYINRSVRLCPKTAKIITLKGNYCIL